VQKIVYKLVALCCLILARCAFAQSAPGSIDLRFNEQISNAPAGTCGCFGLAGGGGDFSWNLLPLGTSHRGAALGAAADFGVVHTSQINDAPYGLTLTTVSAGPRFRLPEIRHVQPFAQALFGFAHGSDSEFPRGNSLVTSANSFALDLGGAADYSINKTLSVRILQLDYLRTSLPNIGDNWQNSLRIGVGATLHFGLSRIH
jgi:hypothetical protein